MKKYILTALTAVLLCSGAVAQNKDVKQGTSAVAPKGKVDRTKAPKAGPAPKIQIGNAEKFVLDNGLTVLLVENHKLPRVSFQLNVDYVPFLEGDVAGNAEIAGTVLKAGTKNRSKAQIDEEIDFVGATLSTSSDGIYASSLTKHSEKLLEILSDVLLNPTFPVEEIDKQKKQTISSLMQAKEDANAIAANVSKVLRYGKDHPFGEITTENTVKNVSQESVRKFYETYFKPNTSYLVIVGDVNRVRAEELAKKYFGAWQRGTVPSNTLPTPKEPEGTQVVFVPKTAAVQSVVSVTYPVDYRVGTPDAIKASVMNSILGGGVFSGRLMQNLRENKAYTYGANSQLSSSRYMGYFNAGASVRNEVTDSSITEIIYEMRRMRNEPVTEAEYSRIKNYMNGSFARSLESPQTIANFALNRELYKLPAEYYSNYLTNLSAVSITDVQETAKKYIKPDNAYILVVGNKEIAPKLTKFDSDKEITYLDVYGNEASLSELKPAPAGVTAQSVFTNAVLAFTGTKDMAAAQKKLKSIKDVTIKSTSEIQGQQLEFVQYIKTPNKIAMNILAGGNVVQKMTFNGTKGRQVSMQGSKDMDAEEAEDFKSQAELAPEINYTEANGYTAVLKGVESVNGKDAYVIDLTKKDKTSTLYYDVTSGLQVRKISTEEGPQGKQSQVIDLGEYKDFNGFLFPSTTTLPLGGGMNLVLTTTSVEFNKKLSDDLFN